MSNIHYFQRYSQKENVVTNNTLHLLLRLHSFSRSKFSKFMEQLCAESNEDLSLSDSWLSFQQQRTSGQSVVDGYISQDSIKIVVETKMHSGFSVEQLKKHLRIFRNEDKKILLLLCPSPEDVQAILLDQVRHDATGVGARTIVTSFDVIIRIARECLSPHDDDLNEVVLDYEAFCSDLELLPRDKFAMFVPPCSQSIEENVKYRLYYCPATWTRRRAHFLGIYSNRSVQYIGRVGNIVQCEANLEEASIQIIDEMRATSLGEKERILGAVSHAKSRGWDISTGHKFFILDECVPTEYRKASPRGIQGHRYFDLGVVLGNEKLPELETIAEQLKLKSWD